MSSENTEGVTKHSSRTSFNSAIKKAYKAIYKGDKKPAVSLSARKQLDYLFQALCRKAYHVMNETTHSLNQKTLGKKNARKAIQVLADLDLAQEILEHANEAARTFEETADKRSKSKKGKLDRMAATEQTGLFVAPSLVNKYLRLSNPGIAKVHNVKSLKKITGVDKNGKTVTIEADLAASKYEARVSAKAKLTIAAFIDYLLVTIIQRASDVVAEVGDKVRLTPRHLLLGVHSDDLLSAFFRKNNIYLVEAGVSPYFPGFLEITSDMKKLNRKKKNKANKNREAESEGKRRGKLPGTVAIRNIVKYQASTKVIIQYQPIYKMVKALLPTENKDGKPYRVNRDAVLHLQDYAESHVIKLMREALEYRGEIAKRISLDPRVLAKVAVNHGIDLQSVKSVASFKVQTIANLARKAGSRRNLKRAGAENSLVEVVGSIIEALVQAVLVPAVADMLITGQSTFRPKYLRQGAFAAGIIIPSFPNKKKRVGKEEKKAKGGKGRKRASSKAKVGKSKKSRKSSTK